VDEVGEVEVGVVVAEVVSVSAVKTFVSRGEVETELEVSISASVVSKYHHFYLN